MIDSIKDSKTGTTYEIKGDSSLVAETTTLTYLEDELAFFSPLTDAIETNKIYLLIVMLHEYTYTIVAKGDTFTSLKVIDADGEPYDIRILVQTDGVYFIDITTNTSDINQTLGMPEYFEMKVYELPITL